MRAGLLCSQDIPPPWVPALTRDIDVLRLHSSNTFSGGFTDGSYAYFVPGRGESGLSRVDLNDFATISSYRLNETNDAWTGFSGGFTDGTFGYLVPFASKEVPMVYHGKTVRFRLNNLNDITVLDLAHTDSDLVGFKGGFSDGTYAYYSPHKCHCEDVTNCFPSDPASKVARVSLAEFNSVEVLDLADTDSDLKGFGNTFF